MLYVMVRLHFCEVDYSMIWGFILFVGSLSLLLIATQQSVGFGCALLAWVCMAWSEWMFIGKIKTVTDVDALAASARKLLIIRLMLNIFSLTTYSFMLICGKFGTNGLRKDAVLINIMSLIYYFCGIYFAVSTVGKVNAKVFSFLLILFFLRPANMGFSFLSKFLFGRWI